MRTKKEKEPGEEENLWTNYAVSLEVLERLYGGLPKDPALIEGFLRGKGLTPAEASARAESIAAEIDQSVPEGEEENATERMWTGFKRDEKGIYIETRQIKAMLKEACGESEMWREYSGLKSRLAGAVFPKGEGGADQTRIYLYRDGSLLTQPDGYEESVGHVRGPQGPRSILKRKDYVERPSISFILKVGGKTVTEKILKDLLEFGSELGLGADRSCEKGKFKITKFERIV